MAKIYRGKKGKRLVMIRVSRIEEADREFDIEFWQSLGTEAIFKAAWELVVDAHIHKGGKKSELRLQKTVTNFSKI